MPLKKAIKNDRSRIKYFLSGALIVMAQYQLVHSFVLVSEFQSLYKKDLKKTLPGATE